MWEIWKKKNNKKLPVKLYHTKFNDCQQKDYQNLVRYHYEVDKT